MTKGNEVEIKAEYKKLEKPDDPAYPYAVSIRVGGKVEGGITDILKPEAEEICRRINEPNRIVDLIEGMIKEGSYMEKEEALETLLKRISQKEGE